jgi:hypothetical protein
MSRLTSGDEISGFLNGNATGSFHCAGTWNYINTFIACCVVSSAFSRSPFRFAVSISLFWFVVKVRP